MASKEFKYTKHGIVSVIYNTQKNRLSIGTYGTKGNVKHLKVIRITDD